MDRVATVTSKERARALELKYAFRFKLLDFLGVLHQTAIPWIGIVGIFGLMYLSIETLAGRMTNAQIAVSFMGNMTISKGLAYLAAILGMGYGHRERGLRRSTIERLTA